MSKGGAKASQNVRKLREEMDEQQEQQRLNDVQIKFECHQRAVSSTTSIEKVGDTERTIPSASDVQMDYAKDLYEWVTDFRVGE